MIIKISLCRGDIAYHSKIKQITLKYENMWEDYKSSPTNVCIEIINIIIKISLS